MASKICVPCDFGVENLHDPFHGNVTVQFCDDTNIEVNSLILSWNSSTFCYFFNELRLQNVKIKDFSKDVVMLFLESMYSGDITIEKCTFREMYKLSSAFKTNWQTDRCREFFYLLCENVSNEFEDLLFVFDEALYAASIHKTEDLISKVTDRFSGMENIENVFVKRFLHENYSSIKSETLEILLFISQDVSTVVAVLKEQLTDGEIDNTARTLLANSKIVEYFANNMECYGEIYELLVHKTDNMTVDDLKMLTNLNLCVIKANVSLSKANNKQVVLVKDIPNLFHNEDMFRNNMSVEEIIERLSSIPNMTIFMVLELCMFYSSVRENILQIITQICATKSLCRVPSTFVQNSSSCATRDKLTSLPQTVVSDNDTVVIEGTETPTLNELVTSAKFYKFYFKHPLAPRCEKDTECGFMLKVTPCSMEEAGTFNIELVTEEYPADIHYHEISAAHMHLAVEQYYKNRWYNMCISWSGKPEYSERGVKWGRYLCNNSRVRLVVYYDIRDN